MGLDPDGLSSSLDLMKNVNAFCFNDEPSEGPTGDPDEMLSSEEPEDEETIQAYDWEWKTSQV